MKTIWVVDTKCTVHPESSLPQDGSQYYYGRSAVSADNAKAAIDSLREELESDHIFIEEVIRVISSADRDWSEDDEFEITESIEDAKESKGIALGCFLSERTM